MNLYLAVACLALHRVIGRFAEHCALAQQFYTRYNDKIFFLFLPRMFLCSASSLFCWHRLFGPFPLYIYFLRRRHRSLFLLRFFFAVFPAVPCIFDIVFPFQFTLSANGLFSPTSSSAIILFCLRSRKAVAKITACARSVQWSRESPLCVCLGSAM